MCPYMPWGEETSAQRRAAFQVGLRLGSRVVGIGNRGRRGLLYLCESDNFFAGGAGSAAANRLLAASAVQFVKMGRMTWLPVDAPACQT